MNRAEIQIPKVGDTVVLNDSGLVAVYGSTVGLAHMKTLKMKIKYVDPRSMTDDQPSHIVEVDNPDLNRFMLIHWDFDIVASGPDTTSR